LTVVVIDPATGGIAGLYLDPYLEPTSSGEVIGVGAYASRSSATLRYFYRRTDLAVRSRYRLGAFRMPLRYLENVLGLLRCVGLIVRERPSAVWYALSSNLLSELLFIAVLRVFGINVAVICHDVVPFVSAREIRSLKDFQRRQFYRIGRTLIVHNLRSIAELRDLYGIDERKLRYLPLPIVDLRGQLARLTAGASERTAQRSGVNFLFIGHVRPEKAVDLLVKAWSSVAERLPNAHLTVAGLVPPEVDIGKVEDVPGFTLLNRYIDEDTYVEMIAAADVVVFPYRAGTNSAVLSNVVSLGKPVIVSDIEMFKQSGLAPDWAYFPAGDVDALAAKIQAMASFSEKQLEEARDTIAAIRDQRILEFSEGLATLVREAEANKRPSR
jgi:glycosyltransferase involved in cell wall biosynthesis